MRSSILRFVVFMGAWGGGGVVASRPPLTRCAGAHLEGEPLGAALIVAPLEGSLRLSKKCIVGASSARP